MPNWMRQYTCRKCGRPVYAQKSKEHLLCARCDPGVVQKQRYAAE